MLPRSRRAWRLTQYTLELLNAERAWLGLAALTMAEVHHLSLSELREQLWDLQRAARPVHQPARG